MRSFAFSFPPRPSKEEDQKNERDHRRASDEQRHRDACNSGENGDDGAESRDDHRESGGEHADNDQHDYRAERVEQVTPKPAAIAPAGDSPSPCI